MSGRTVTPDGNPIPNVTVTLGSSIATTTVDGRFELPRAQGKLRLSHPRYFPREIAAATIPPAPLRAEAVAASIVLVPGARVAGSTRAAAGHPIGGARIEVGTSEVPLSATTRADGAFESPLLHPGTVFVLARHPGFQPASRVVTVPADGSDARCDLTLEPGAPLALAVRQPAGEPLADVEVWVRPAPVAGSAASAEWAYHGRTGDLGTLDTRVPLAGEHKVRLSLAGYREETLAVPTGERARLDVRLQPAPAIRGHAVNADTGLPVRIEDLRLEVAAGESFVEAPHRGRLFESLAAGKFVLGLPADPGTYRVVVVAETSGDLPVALEGRSEPIAFPGIDPTTAVVVALRERIELRGQVDGPTGPVEGLRIELIAAPIDVPADLRDDPWALPTLWETASHAQAMAAAAEATATSEAQGQFVFKDLRPGTYRLRARPQGFAEYLSAAFAVPWEGRYPVILRRGATLTGRVLASNGEPERGAAVSVYRSDALLRQARTDAEGHFRFEGLPPGDSYALEAAEASSAPSPRSTRRAFSLEEGKTVVFDLHRSPPLPLPIPPPATSPTDPQGQIQPAVANAPDSAPVPTPAASKTEPAARSLIYRLELMDALTGEPYRMPTRVQIDEVSGRRSWEGSGRSGLIEAGGLAAGNHRIRVWTGKLLQRDETLDLQQDRIDSLSLRPPEEVPVRLLVAEDEPFMGEAEVTLFQAGKEIYRSTEIIEETVLVPTPGPGDYEIAVQAPGYRTRFGIRVDGESP